MNNEQTNQDTWLDILLRMPIEDINRFKALALANGMSTDHLATAILSARLNGQDTVGVLAKAREIYSQTAYGLEPGDLELLLQASGKPDEIRHPSVVQRQRVRELLHWFARFRKGNANPKWQVEHAFELAYFIATNSQNALVDYHASGQAAFLEGTRVKPNERAMLERYGEKDWPADYVPFNEYPTLSWKHLPEIKSPFNTNDYDVMRLPGIGRGWLVSIRYEGPFTEHAAESAATDDPWWKPIWDLAKKRGWTLVQFADYGKVLDELPVFEHND